MSSRSRVLRVAVEFTEKGRDVRVLRDKGATLHKEVSRPSYMRLARLLEHRIHSGKYAVEFGLFGYAIWS